MFLIVLKTAKRIARPFDKDELNGDKDAEICPCCGYSIVILYFSIKNKNFKIF